MEVRVATRTPWVADLMRMVMAELAEIISADSILVKAHLYPGE